jgi:uncharacterized protein YkwD
MNYINALLLIIVAVSVWAGVARGFIISGLALLSWMGSLVIGLFAYAPLSSLLLKMWPFAGVWSAPLSFIISVILARLILDTLANKVLEEVPARVHVNIVNRILGVLPGTVNGLIWATLLAAFLLLMPVTNLVSKQTRDGKLAGKLIEQMSWVQEKLSPVFGDALNYAIPKNTVEVSANNPIKLPFTVKDPKDRHDLEAQMLVLVNRERTQRGLNALKADPVIAVVARKHSADMFARGYFSHFTPEGIDPFQRMRKDHIRFLTAGENLALAQTLAIAHNGLMNSPGHRANILNPSFGRVGISILDGGVYGLMITQNFRN